MKSKGYFLTFKLSKFFLLILLLLSFLIINGCSPISTLLFGASGSIEVTTYPSGAKIFLNSNDTGYVTPYTITNLPKGTYEIKVTLGDVSYTKTVIVYSDHTTSVYKDLLPRLSKIIVQPTLMNLEEGESQKIDSVTAYYVDSGSADLTLSDCSYSSSSSHATVNSSGTVTGVSEGSATITVSYTDIEIIKSDTVNVIISPFVPPPVVTPVVYRAFCVGVGDYLNDDVTDLESPEHNVNRIVQVLNDCKFGSDEVLFSSIESLINLEATKEAIISGIASAFSGADENDISYFYFSGHGAYGEGFSTSYICPTDFNGSVGSAISVDELEIALSAIPGTKVVILDSCFSGGFIGKGKEEKIISKEEMISFNDEIINVFSLAQSKGLLTTNQYKVLTASHYDQPSYEILDPLHPKDDKPYAVFTAAFCNGCGYDDGVYHADSNLDTKITLDEIYEHIRGFIIDFFGFNQNVQVFPENSNFAIVEY